MATVSANAPETASLHLLTEGPRRHAPGTVPRRSSVTRRVLSEFAAYAGRRRLSVSAALIVLGTMLEGIGILLIVPVLRILLEPGAARGPVDGSPLGPWLEPFDAGGQYAALFTGFVGLMLLRATVLVARDAQLARLQWGFIETIKLGMFRCVAAASWSDVMAIARPRLNRALGGDMVQVAVAVSAAMQTAAAVLMLTAYCSFALVLAPWLSLLTFGLLAVMVLLGTGLVRRAGAFGRAALGFDLRMRENASQFLTGLKVAKAQGLEAHLVASYAAASRAALDTRVAFVRTMSSSRQLAALLGTTAAVAAVLIAFLTTEVDPAVVVTFVVLLARTAGPAAQVQQGVQHVANALPLFAELQALAAELPAATRPEPRKRTRADSACSISFQAATFAHGPAERGPRGGVRAIDLEIGAREFVGLAGPTGSGKSTLLDLVAGLEKPDAGKLLFDGRELCDEQMAAHCDSLAYLAAEPVLFAGSVRSNLLWAAPEASDEALWQALETAAATELVERLGGGLDGVIHEAGANLSGGERQQIALARALLRHPTLILLDEATSSLDRERECRVLAGLAALEPRPTILLVSHREESFAACDRVVTLSEGEIHSIRRMT